MIEAPIYAPPMPVRFVADCQPCDWQGREHPSNLVALADFDRHAASHKHQAPVELCPDCNHPTDGHDRRAEDGACEACDADPTGGPCSTIIAAILHEEYHR